MTNMIRVWDKELKTMIYSDDILIGMYFCNISDGEIKISRYDIKENKLKEIPIMNYIGITDKQGKKIYEGDIVRAIDKEYGIEIRGIVDFVDGSFVISNEWFKGYRWLDYEVEVIGNIYENVEILEILYSNIEF